MRMMFLIGCALLAGCDLGKEAVGTDSRSGVEEKGNLRAAALQAKNLEASIKLFFLDQKQYPASLQDLVDRPADLSADARWSPYLVGPVPLDPWENEFYYAPEGEGGFTLFSLGPDGKPGTADDIKP